VNTLLLRQADEVSPGARVLDNRAILLERRPDSFAPHQPHEHPLVWSQLTQIDRRTFLDGSLLL
jgi:hypothetical protein